MRALRRIVVAVVALVVIVVAVGYLALDTILKRTIERESTASLKLATTLGRAHLSLFGGKLNLDHLRIGSPPGFSAPQMLELDDIDVAVKYGELRKQPIHVQSIELKQPTLVIEQRGGSLNFKAAMDRIPRHESSSKEPLRLIIDDLQIKDAKVVIRPGLPGVQQELNVAVPSLSMKDIGTGHGAQNGAAIKDVAMVVISALAAKAAESGSLPAELRALLTLNVGQVAGKLGAEAGKLIGAAVPGPLGQTLSRAAADPGALVKDPAKAVQGELGGILGGKNNDKPAGRSAPKR